MVKEILERMKNDKEIAMIFTYKLVKNNETGTFHIIKAPVNNWNQVIERNAELVYKHKPNILNKYNLNDINFYLQEINFNIFNWERIETIRLASAILANKGYNVCGNCVRELYKNEGEDID